jgi:hypothetical protein
VHGWHACAPLGPLGRLTGMGIYLRLMPGVKVRLGRRGVRWGLGPRALRYHTGGGYRSGLSTGAGPVTWYRPLRRRRRR